MPLGRLKEGFIKMKKKLLLAIVFVFVSSAICNSAEKVSCAYPELNTNIMTDEKICGEIIDDDLLIINKNVSKKINWNDNGLECIYVYGTKRKDGWYIVNQSGKGRISSFWTDNTCAPFSEGLTVGLSKGTVIFYNQRLEVIKRTNYVWASNFHKGYSKVCVGNLKKQYDSKSEHYQHTGGSCGYIDTDFKVVVPLDYDFAETPEPYSK